MALLYLNLLVILAGFLSMVIGIVRFLLALFGDKDRARKVNSAAGLLGGGFCLMVMGVIFQPRMVRSPDQGQLTACRSNLKNIATALEMYATDYEGKYPSSLTLLTPNYLRSLPTCPAARVDTYSPTYKLISIPIATPSPGVAATPQVSSTTSLPKLTYHVACRGENHEKAGVTTPDRPAYNGIQGLIEEP